MSRRFKSLHPRRRLCLTRLEDRVAPAVATWDGGGTTDGWSDPQNWVGDVTPQSGDDLAFPAGAARLNAVNDFPLTVVMPFGQLRLTSNGYRITGGAISLSGGITANLPFGAGEPNSQIDLPIILAADQSFTRTDFSNTRGLTLTGPVDLAGHTLTVSPGPLLAFAGPITGAGALNVTGFGLLRLTAVNTFTGPTTVTGSPDTSLALQVDGSIGNVVLANGALSGRGTIGSVTGSPGFVDPGDFIGSGANFVGTLTVGDLTLTNGGSLEIHKTTSDQDRIVARGTVQLDANLGVGFNSDVPIHRGETFTVIDNDGTDPVVGTFRDLPEGAIIFAGTGVVPLRITYHGGDGNDVVLVATSAPFTAVGAGAGGVPVANVYDFEGNLMRSFLAYDAAFRGGVRVAVADMNGDGIKDIITAPGPGGGPHIKVFDGVTGAVIRQWMAYDPAFTGGVFVATAPIDAADSVPEIVTGAGAGGGPHVKVFNGATGAVISGFMAYDPAFTGGVSVSALPPNTVSFITGSGQKFVTFPPLIVTGAGPGGGPHVRIFNASTLAVQKEFFAYDPAFRGGVNVAVALANPQSNLAYVITAPGPGMEPVVKVFGTDDRSGGRFDAYAADFRGGVTISAMSGFAPTILTGAGPGGGPHVRQWRLPPDFQNGNSFGFVLERDFFAFDPNFRGGVFVG